MSAAQYDNPNDINRILHRDVLLVSKSNFTDIGQVAVALRKVNPVADNKSIWDLKADPIGVKIGLSTARFV